MKFLIPPILGKVELSDYAAEMGEQVLIVWLNPPSGLLREYNDCRKRVGQRAARLRGMTEEADRDAARALAAENQVDVDRMVEIAAELLSQGPEDTHVSAADLNAMIDELSDANPRFYSWLVGHVFDAIADYRMAEKKSAAPD